MKHGAIRVFIADDHAMVREALAALVDQEPDLCVVGQAGDGLEVLEQVQRLDPHVLVLDISMPGLNGLDVCRELSKRRKNLSVLILTMHDDERYVTAALRNGASGYLLKHSSAGQLTEALRRIARGEIYLGPGISRNILMRVGREAAPDPHELLTTRERQVLQLIAEGATNRQIAEKFQLSVKTVDTHRTRLMRKLNIHDQTSLVKYAIRKGIVPLN